MACAWCSDSDGSQVKRLLASVTALRMAGVTRIEFESDEKLQKVRREVVRLIAKGGAFNVPRKEGQPVMIQGVELVVAEDVGERA